MTTSLFGHRKQQTHGIPQTTAMQKQRIKQVSSLRTHFPGMQEVRKDAEYQIRFKDSAGVDFTAFLQLPPNFPNERPSVLVYPPLDHPWVDKNISSVVGCKPLNDFSMHQDLGKVLGDLVKELSSHKANNVVQRSFDSAQPTDAHRYSPSAMFSSASMPEPVDAILDFADTAPSHLSHQTIVPNLEQQEEMAKWIKNDVIEVLDTEVLRELNASNDDGAMLAYVDLEGFQKEGMSERVRLLHENMELAQENLNFQPLLEQERRVLEEKQSTMDQLLIEFKTREQEQSKLSQFSEFRVMKSLEERAIQDSTQAENLADEFLRGEIGLERFLTEFREKKESSYTRSAKQIKINHILSDVSNLQQFTALK